MSSHHFVKEGQEPALVILEAFSLEAVEPLLEWAPLVVVFENALEEVLRWGIKLDVVVARKENIASHDSRLSDQGPLEFLEYDTDHMRSIMAFLIGKKQSAVTIVSNAHDEPIKTSQYFGDKLNVSILTASKRWSYIAVGHFKKWFPQNAILEIRAAAPVNVVGKPFSGTQLVMAADGILSIESSEGFWVGESVQ